MRQQVSIGEIKSGLVRQLHNVISRYVKPSADAYEKHGKLFTLNPGRFDRSVGSFCITLSGPDAGRWADFAMPARAGSASKHLTGDVLDLIGLCLNLDEAKDVIKEAREFLGLDTESPEQARKRREADKKAEKQREMDRQKRETDKKQYVEQMLKNARGLWFSAQERIIGSPVDHYLKGRCIDLATLPHQPGAIRFHPECRYYYDIEHTDPETGEFTKRKVWRTYPAMVTAITRGKEIIDCHRTYLAFDDQVGLWRKAPLSDAKKVFTDYTGGAVRLCGALGPRGGQMKLNDAPQGSKVFIAEGIENALSLITLRQLRGSPPAFVVAAGAIWNMAEILLATGAAAIGRGARSGRDARSSPWAIWARPITTLTH